MIRADFLSLPSMTVHGAPARVGMLEHVFNRFDIIFASCPIAKVLGRDFPPLVGRVQSAGEALVLFFLSRVEEQV